MPPIPDHFLRAIADHPDDDGPRLVCADWLDEQGDPRGEFIRVQRELAGLPVPPAEWTLQGNDRWVALRQRERALFADHADDWFRSLRALFGLDVLLSCADIEPADALDYRACMVIRRGFVEEVTASAADWLTHADALRALTPLRRVVLTSQPINDTLASLKLRFPGIDFRLPEMEEARAV
jgi:uncharacterized protein (TIGR02996 family)